ncbi:hypothetical protein QYE76_046423 [Lolium multiflorum]|uniref:RNase H type-1 domain-containing protein n=1 Tax=Lolium multiflorum TaxID=4521 RepID=A0AAD8WYM0_LOLMU|nr:hypothetical protein QYE76_046423 [Lolium multiflorum]
MDRGKQIAAGLVDFVPHPPSRLDAYAYLAEPMEMTFGRFHFRVEKEGSYRVEIPISSGSSAVDSDFSSYASSTESGEEETSATRYVSTRAREKLAKIFNDMSFESSADSYISDGSSDVDSYDFIDKSITVGKVFINLNDDVTKPNIDLSTKYHQIYAIEDQEETSEAFDDLGNPYVDPSNLRQGLGNKYVGPEPRDRVQLSQAAWDRAARAMNGSEPMATTATPEELQAYQYRLARAARELEKQTAELNRRKEAASASSRRRADLSRQSRTTGDSHREARNRARSRLQHIPEAEREHLVQNLDMSFMSIDTRGNIIPKTPEAGYMATHAFILASKPPPGDPRETLYNMAVAGVGAMGTAFVSTPPEGAARQNSPRPAAATAAAPEGPSGARDTAAQARVDRARQSRRDHRQSPELNDEDMCGLPCFTRRVRKTRVPSGFKLPDNFKKFDGLQDPEDWLVDYLETVKLTGGTRATAMQSIQVHLSGAARSWIKKLTPGSIDSWESFEDVFVKNFRSTLKEEDEVKTAFITPYGVFCYRTMPFGLKNAGATYQRMMQKCLATQIGKNVQVYIDDVVITSKKGATLIEDLKETFDNLDKFCLKLNPTKCSFGVPAGELLGFLVSARGIEANPDKIQAIVTMRKPTKLKEIQQLTGRVAALSRFVARLGEKALPFYALIKQGDKFQWNEEADRAFEDLKRTISTPPILVAPKEREPLLLYIAATPQVVSTVLVVEREEEGKLHGVQRPVYFVSEVLSPSKQRYPQYQKIAYGVFTTARKLRHYFSAHPIIVVNEAPLSNILNNPEATGRVSLWGIELSPRDITYEKRKAIKSQILPDFIAEWMELQNTGPPDLSRTWTMNFDGSKRLEGAGAGVVLISPEGDKLKYILRMTFPNASNNEAEYEALIHGMKMAKACGATRLKIFGDSQLVAQQVMNQCDAVNDSMMAYKEVYNELEKLFDGCEVNHISRLSNDEADVLANIGSQCLAVPPGVFWEEITERSTKSTKSKKKEKKPSGATKEKQEEEEEDQDLVMVIQIPWMQTYISYILRKEIPDDPVEARRVIRRSKAFTVVKGELYKRSISGVLQRCVTPEEGRIILKDVHEGICGHHASSRAIAAKVFRAGFYWLTAIEDAKDIVRTCDACQRIKDKKTGVEEPNPWNVAQLRRFYA